MTVKELIQNVEDLKVHLNEVSVYDLDVHTSMDLYYTIAKKFNVVIKELMRFEGVISDEVIKQNEKLIYLLGEGLNTEVVNKINQMVADGTMDTIINHNVFSSLNNKIEDYKYELSSQIKENESKKIPSNRLDVSSDDAKIKQINLSTEVLDLIKNPVRSIGTLSNGGLYYSADINGDPQVYPNDSRKNVMNKQRIQVANGKEIIIKANYPIQIIVYNYKDGVANGMSYTEWTDYYEGMTIPIKHDSTEFNITIHKTDGTDILETDYIEIFQGGRSIYQTFADKSITKEKIADRTLTDDQQKQIWGYFIGKDSVVYDTIANTVTFKSGINIVTDRKEILYKDSIPSINLNDFNGDMVYVYVNREDNNIYAKSFKCDEFKKANTCLLLSFYDGVVNGLDTSSVKVIKETSLPTFTVTSHWKGKKANFIGDSITIGSWGGTTGNNWSNISRPYPVVLGELLELDTVRNYGIGGSHISSAFNSTDSPSSDAMATRFINMDNDADLIVVAGGTNDYGHTDTAPFGTIADTTDISFYGALNVMCKGLVEKYLGKTIVFMTPLHRANDTNVNPTTGKTLEDYCNAIKEVCGLYGIKVIDNFHELGFCPKVGVFQSTYMEDGLHPNPTGHELMANRLYPVFNSIG